jgi:hypothetical protein
MILEINPQALEYKRNFQNWCTLPYPKHPRGCPNYGSKRDLRGIKKNLKSRVIRECPPTRLIDDVLDFSKSIYLIYNKYPLGKDAETRRLTHPNLKTNGDWYNLRYWQGTARKQLYLELTRFLEENPGTIVDLCPEAHGVNLLALMQKPGIDIKLEFGKWPPVHSLENVKYQICLGGYPKRKDL